MRSGYDISGLTKFAALPDWRSYLTVVFAEHLGPAMIEFDLTRAEIAQILGEHWTRILWGVAFEDFATRQFDPDRRNLISDYLKRRSWNEETATKAYLRALRRSSMSLYEVSKIEARRGFVARDLIRGGAPIFVSEVEGSATLRPWDRVGARIVFIGEQRILSGGVLSFTMAEGDALLCDISKSAIARATPRTTAQGQNLAHLISSAWLFSFLAKTAGATIAPPLLNRDQNDIIFYRIRYNIRPNVHLSTIRQQLSSAPELKQVQEGNWIWLRPLTPATLANTVREDGPSTLLASETVILGRILLDKGYLTLSVNSNERAKLGMSLITRLLDDFVVISLTSIQTINREMEDSFNQDRLFETSIPSSVTTPLAHGMLDRHYRSILDQPVPMLENVTPRAAATTVHGQERIVKWLKLIENRAGNQMDSNDPMVTYDFEWIWRELNVAHLRF